jgi:hypothetical protein
VGVWTVQRRWRWRVVVRRVGVRRVRMVAVEEELAAAGCAHAVRGAVGVGGAFGGGGSLHEQGCAEKSHRAAQLEEEQNKCEHRVAGSTGDSDCTLTESPGRTS